MREEWRRWKDLVVASAIVLVLLSSRAGGQVDVSFFPGDGSGTEAAMLALETSREALLDARDAIEAALKEVDLAMATLDAASPRTSRSRVAAKRKEAAPLPSVEALRELGRSALAGVSALAGGLTRWADVLRARPQAVGGATRPATEESAGAGIAAAPAGTDAGQIANASARVERAAPPAEASPVAITGGETSAPGPAPGRDGASQGAGDRHESARELPGPLEKIGAAARPVEDRPRSVPRPSAP